MADSIGRLDIGIMKYLAGLSPTGYGSSGHKQLTARLSYVYGHFGYREPQEPFEYGKKISVSHPKLGNCIQQPVGFRRFEMSVCMFNHGHHA